MSKTIEVSMYRGRTWLVCAEMQGPIKTENPAFGQKEQNSMNSFKLSCRFMVYASLHTI
jgi:hypothetical protein